MRGVPLVESTLSSVRRLGCDFTGYRLTVWSRAKIRVSPFSFPLGQVIRLDIDRFFRLLSRGERRIHWIEMEHFKTTELYSKVLFSSNILLRCCRNKLVILKSHTSHFQWVSCYNCRVCSYKSWFSNSVPLSCLSFYGASQWLLRDLGVVHGKASRLQALAH